MELKWNYDWTEVSSEDSPYVDVQHLTCKGAMFELEILVHDNGDVSGTLWAEIPATYWEPADMTSVFMSAFDSVDEAKAELEGRDTEYWESEVEMDDKHEREYAAYLESQEN